MDASWWLQVVAPSWPVPQLCQAGLCFCCSSLAAEPCCLVADAFASVQERVQDLDMALGRRLHHEGGVWSKQGVARPSQGCCLRDPDMQWQPVSLLLLRHRQIPSYRNAKGALPQLWGKIHVPKQLPEMPGEAGALGCNYKQVSYLLGCSGTLACSDLRTVWEHGGRPQSCQAALSRARSLRSCSGRPL